MIQIKRAYDEASPDDGYRVLVDRLWPRGMRREALQADDWLPVLAPSGELRRWFGHDPERWEAFRERYLEELRTPEKQRVLRQLAERARDSTVTLVYGAKDQAHNNAVVLRDLLKSTAYNCVEE